MSNVGRHDEYASRKCLTAVTKERGGKFEEAFGAAARLKEEFGEPRLAELVASQVPDSVPCEVVSDLLGILEWSTQDNGAAIRRQAEQWLIEGRDLRKIQIALGLEAYPFETMSQMAKVLKKLAETHPQVALRCMQLIEQRQAAAGA
jgi:hypothetical protein